MSALGPSELRRAADARAGALARRFGDALRVGDGAGAEGVVNDALASGMSPEAVQSLVIAPAMVRIGELWETGAIGVADEHLATAISQRSMIRLFESMSARHARPRSRERILLAAVEGQHHVLGLRMIADVLEGAGFDVLYLGQDVPVESLSSFVKRHQPAVAGLGFGFCADIGALADAVWSVHERAPGTRIMLGGAAVPSGLQTTGIPHVTSSLEVVAVVDALLAAPPAPLPKMIELLRTSGPWRAGPRADVVKVDAIAEALAHVADDAGEIAREHIRRAEAYRELAYRDTLTDLANRRAFEDDLGLASRAGGAGGTLMMIDVDGFKAVNDEHGHDAGDRLLRLVGEAISGAIRPGDVAARIGGDEFAVLLPGASAAMACPIGDRIRAAVSEKAAGVSVSIGVADLSDGPRATLLAADTALYEAKTTGRDRVVAARRTPSSFDERT